MRVLYFHQHFSTPEGATGIRSYEMAKRLVESGHHVTMVCGSYKGGNTGLKSEFVNGKREGNVQGISVVEYDLAYANKDGFLRRTFTFLSFAFKSTLLTFKLDYDVVFATTTPLTAGIPGIFARWLRRKPFVFEVRDLWPELPKAMGVIKNPIVLWAMSALEYVSYRSAHCCIALSPGIVEGIAKRGVARDKITLVPNGCDLSIFNASNINSWRPALIKDTDFLAVFTGTHGMANGLDAALDAAKELKKRERNDIKLLLIGQGKLKDQLIQRAQKEGLDNVVFHDPVDKEMLAKLMLNADIGMQLLANIPAFYYGTSPNKFFDYISAGLPVLNNYPGWLSELINENQCGFSVPPDNPQAFADALEQAFSDRVKLKMMGEHARRLAKKNFDRSMLSKRWVNALNGVVK